MRIKYRIWADENISEYDDSGDWGPGWIPGPIGYWACLTPGGNIVFGVEDEPENEINPDKAPISVEQWTGLVDRNGREIYEGDLVAAVHDPEEICLVERIPGGAFGYRIEYDQLFFDLAEFDNVVSGPIVVGNIHENPELLEEA